MFGKKTVDITSGLVQKSVPFVREEEEEEEEEGKNAKRAKVPSEVSRREEQISCHRHSPRGSCRWLGERR